ncbi:hypothetical protein COU78_06810 [Candidatus Peregrinibacteria bacterium CG10_big_fil_rev_8_21_14_0_10_49_24]|nr:MAG: hypothetical protein COV83_02100 [Candidatus Peregrinibacteria bacterium CG11_big_fil_rev_8_21_14_0_20_49_14]PIR50400.1 MAG: hypothetical protein COU78_06810 [Candidatus Peregrinibacteria bacterium CG10_big_fil_rev_8_21_14_0_10_49_24]PJA67489.1 MAG: hypothetical protein CO157_03600 [Candidatus Peregrinibacteria bacterium CG_4_9_14_3_um_filter_49_12]
MSSATDIIIQLGSEGAGDIFGAVADADTGDMRAAARIIPLHADMLMDVETTPTNSDRNVIIRLQ